MKEQQWCCINKSRNGKPSFRQDTLSYTRKESIKKLIGEGTLTWRQCKEKYGWKCVKITMTLEII